MQSTRFSAKALAFVFLLLPLLGVAQIRIQTNFNPQIADFLDVRQRITTKADTAVLNAGFTPNYFITTVTATGERLRKEPGLGWVTLTSSFDTTGLATRNYVLAQLAISLQEAKDYADANDEAGGSGSYDDSALQERIDSVIATRFDPTALQAQVDDNTTEIARIDAKPTYNDSALTALVSRLSDTTVVLRSDLQALIAAGGGGGGGGVTTGGGQLVVAATSTSRPNYSSGSYKVLSYNEEEYDPEEVWNGSRFQPTIAGWYKLAGAYGVEDAINEMVLTWGVFKNGGLHKLMAYQRPAFATGSSGVLIISGSVPVYLNGTTDFVELEQFQNSGANVRAITGYGNYVYIERMTGGSSGGGGAAYDDTEVRAAIERNLTSIDSLRALNHEAPDLSAYLTRAELPDSLQAMRDNLLANGVKIDNNTAALLGLQDTTRALRTDVNDLLNRPTGGETYDDSELRNRVTDAETDLNAARSDIDGNSARAAALEGYRLALDEQTDVLTYGPFGGVDFSYFRTLINSGGGGGAGASTGLPVTQDSLEGLSGPQYVYVNNTVELTRDITTTAPYAIVEFGPAGQITGAGREWTYTGFVKAEPWQNLFPDATMLVNLRQRDVYANWFGATADGLVNAEFDVLNDNYTKSYNAYRRAVLAVTERGLSNDPFTVRFDATVPGTAYVMGDVDESTRQGLAQNLYNSTDPRYVFKESKSAIKAILKMDSPTGTIAFIGSNGTIRGGISGDWESTVIALPNEYYNVADRDAYKAHDYEVTGKTTPLGDAKSQEGAVEYGEYGEAGWEDEPDRVAAFALDLPVGSTFIPFKGNDFSGRFSVGEPIVLTNGAHKFDVPVGSYRIITKLSSAGVFIDAPLTRDYSLKNANTYGKLAQSFVMPAEGATVEAVFDLPNEDDESRPGAIQDKIFNLAGDIFERVAIGTNGYVIRNLAGQGNSAPGTTIPAGTDLLKFRAIVPATRLVQNFVVRDMTVVGRRDGFRMGNQIGNKALNFHLAHRQQNVTYRDGLSLSIDGGRDFLWRNGLLTTGVGQIEGAQIARGTRNFWVDNVDFSNIGIEIIELSDGFRYTNGTWVLDGSQNTKPYYPSLKSLLQIGGSTGNHIFEGSTFAVIGGGFVNTFMSDAGIGNWNTTPGRGMDFRNNTVLFTGITNMMSHQGSGSKITGNTFIGQTRGLFGQLGGAPRPGDPLALSGVDRGAISAPSYGGPLLMSDNQFYVDAWQIFDRAPRALVADQSNRIVRQWASDTEPANAYANAGTEGGLVSAGNAGEPSYDVQIDLRLTGWGILDNNLNYEGSLSSGDYMRFHIDKPREYINGTWVTQATDEVFCIGDICATAANPDGSYNDQPLRDEIAANEAADNDRSNSNELQRILLQQDSLLTLSLQENIKVNVAELIRQFAPPSADNQSLFADHRTDRVFLNIARGGGAILFLADSTKAGLLSPENLAKIEDAGSNEVSSISSSGTLTKKLIVTQTAVPNIETTFTDHVITGALYDDATEELQVQRNGLPNISIPLATPNFYPTAALVTGTTDKKMVVSVEGTNNYETIWKDHVVTGGLYANNELQLQRYGLPNISIPLTQTTSRYVNSGTVTGTTGKTATFSYNTGGGTFDMNWNDAVVTGGLFEDGELRLTRHSLPNVSIPIPTAPARYVKSGAVTGVLDKDITLAMEGGGTVVVPLVDVAVTGGVVSNGELILTRNGTTNLSIALPSGEGAADGNNFPTGLSVLGGYGATKTLEMTRSGLAKLTATINDRYINSVAFSGTTTKTFTGGFSGGGGTATATFLDYVVNSATMSGNTLILGRNGMSDLTVVLPSSGSTTSDGNNYSTGLSITGDFGATKTVEITRSGLSKLSATISDRYLTGQSVTGTATKTITNSFSGGGGVVTSTFTDNDNQDLTVSGASAVPDIGINGSTSKVSLRGGTNVTLDKSGSTITINASGSGGTADGNTTVTDFDVTGNATKTATIQQSNGVSRTATWTDKVLSQTEVDNIAQARGYQKEQQVLDLIEANRRVFGTHTAADKSFSGSITGNQEIMITPLPVGLYTIEVGLYFNGGTSAEFIIDSNAGSTNNQINYATALRYARTNLNGDVTGYTGLYNPFDYDEALNGPIIGVFEVTTPTNMAVYIKTNGTSATLLENSYMTIKRIN
ncbi:hypothetical protein LEM8419_03541 [Neolewinella maritima]|uniref:DUF1983 domain-containing protein n=1 Tax=Neolewinella maritima TaxID=1383882 RepID=A0ABN8FE05_9BACT|nr:hypothetical protein [Neolewinella maritima]CAH1002669.1 hypothetical protein LEM8419_03541 [Neolewinella maritima]